MAGFWSPIDSEEKRARLTFLGGGVAFAIAGLWTAFVYFYPPKPAGGSGGTSVTTTTGGVAAGGDVNHFTQTLRGVEPNKQRSYGSGSPNISNVGGDVEITINK